MFLLFVSEVLKAYGGRLTEYERAEVDKFPEIWFLGLDAAKVLGRPGAPLNSGYDDDNGSYNKVRLMNCQFWRKCAFYIMYSVHETSFV